MVAVAVFVPLLWISSLSRTCADSAPSPSIVDAAIVPNSSNTFFVNPPNSTSDPIIWELGKTQVVRWNTTASPLTLVLYQFIPKTQNYTSEDIFVDVADITSKTWEVDNVEPLDSKGEGLFHLQLVPPNFDPTSGEGFNSITFTIKDPSYQNSSSSPSSSSISAVPSNTPTVNPTSTSPSTADGTTSSSELSASTKKGLGVGLGIGLSALILLSLSGIVWYMRRRKQTPSVPLEYAHAASSVSKQKQSLVEVADTSRGELADDTRREMADTSRSEMDGIGKRAEMGIWNR